MKEKFLLTCGVDLPRPDPPVRTFVSKTSSQLTCSIPDVPSGHRMTVFGVTYAAPSEPALPIAWYCRRIESVKTYLSPEQTPNTLEAESLSFDRLVALCAEAVYNDRISFSISLEVPKEKAGVKSQWSCLYQIFGSEYRSDSLYFAFENDYNFDPAAQSAETSVLSWTDVVLIVLACVMFVTCVGLGTCGLLWYMRHQNRKQRRAKRSRRRNHKGGSRSSLAGPVDHDILVEIG